ncbi:MAG: SHOCT domain-containing protein [Roseovarius sp.]|nr:SHOCT domain-containing protein [Roseovarius sp.]
MKLQAIIATGALTVITSVSKAIAGPGDHGDGNFGHMMWGGGYGWWGGIGMILFWGLIIAVAVFAFRALTDSRSGQTRDAMDILKERYARGEIDEDEFKRRKQELQS